MQEGKHYHGNRDLTNEQISWWTEHGINFSKKKKLKKRVNKNGLIVKNLLAEFNIEFGEFTRSLEKAKIKKVDSEFPENIEEQTLKKFCMERGYNYEIINKAIKLHQFCGNDTLGQLIERIRIMNKNKGEIFSWIYEVYGPLIEQVLLELNLDSTKILQNVSNNIIPLEEAICNQIFSSAYRNKECDYLEEVYKKMIVKIDFQKTEEENAQMFAQEIVRISKRNHLIEDEKTILKDCFFEYLRIIREYQIMDVGLEEIPEEKMKKIKKYNLTEEEIEESYFVPLRFENGLLLERKSELYQRRELLRQYIIDWDYYSEEEKKDAKLEHNFTEVEFSMMEETRNEIDRTIGKMRQIKK